MWGYVYITPALKINSTVKNPYKLITFLHNIERGCITFSQFENTATKTLWLHG